VVAPSAGSVVLVPFPFSDLSQSKLRPAVVLADAGQGDWILPGHQQSVFRRKGSQAYEYRIQDGLAPRGKLRATRKAFHRQSGTAGFRSWGSY